jgi:hypothetical protein
VRRINPFPNWTLGLIVLVTLMHGTSQGGNVTPSHAMAITEAVSCLDKPSQTVRSSTVLSPQGARAYVEVENRLLRGANHEESCRTVWRLYVAAKDKSFSLNQIDELADSEDKENRFDIIGWSLDGNNLLTAIVVAAGDWDETTPVIYSLKEKRFWRVSLRPLFKGIAREDCSLYFRPLGFSAKDGVIFKVGAPEEPDTTRGTKPCFADSIWVLDYQSKNVFHLPDNATFDVVGTVEK